jgi:hypothetical protein
LRSLSLDLHKFETLVFYEKYQESGLIPRPSQDGTYTNGFAVVSFLFTQRPSSEASFFPTTFFFLSAYFQQHLSVARRLSLILFDFYDATSGNWESWLGIGKRRLLAIDMNDSGNKDFSFLLVSFFLRDVDFSLF